MERQKYISLYYLLLFKVHISPAYHKFFVCGLLFILFVAGQNSIWIFSPSHLVNIWMTPNALYHIIPLVAAIFCFAPKSNTRFFYKTRVRLWSIKVKVLHILIINVCELHFVSLWYFHCCKICVNQYFINS